MKPLAIVYIFFFLFWLIDILDFKTNVAHSKIWLPNQGKYPFCSRVHAHVLVSFSPNNSPNLHSHQGTLSQIESLSNFALETM